MGSRSVSVISNVQVNRWPHMYVERHWSITQPSMLDAWGPELMMRAVWRSCPTTKRDEKFWSFYTKKKVHVKIFSHNEFLISKNMDWGLSNQKNHFPKDFWIFFPENLLGNDFSFSKTAFRGYKYFFKSNHLFNQHWKREKDTRPTREDTMYVDTTIVDQCRSETTLPSSQIRPRGDPSMRNPW